VIFLKGILRMEFHPFSNEYPMMPDEDVGRMEINMRDNGFDPRFPIVTYQGKVLDGRNRYLASSRAEVSPVIVSFTGNDEQARLFVQTANEHRRHLTREWLERLRQDRMKRIGPKRKEGKSVRTIAAEENVSPSTIHRELNELSDQGEDVEPEEIVGQDGKTRPAKRADPTLCPRCQRCQRVGMPVPKSCEMCKELREPKKDEKPKASDAVLDCFGTPVPPERRGALLDPWVTKAIDTIAMVEEQLRKARLADGMRKRAKHYPFFDEQDFIDGVGMAQNTLDQLLSHLKGNRPAAVCPMCEGKGCADCKLSGLVPRALHATLKAKK